MTASTRAVRARGHRPDHFWTAISGSRGRAHVQDGTTVEYTYQPNETRHGRLGKGEFRVHDLENIGDHEMVFVTVEFKDSANKPMALPPGVEAARPSPYKVPRRQRAPKRCRGSGAASSCRVRL